MKATGRITYNREGPQAGRTVAARDAAGLLRQPRRLTGERKVRAPQDAVVGNADRPRASRRGTEPGLQAGLGNLSLGHSSTLPAHHVEYGQTLPRCLTAAGPGPTPTFRDRPHARRLTPVAERHTILVVDDEPDVV